jgi:CRP-like cAMP-binding protein
MGYALRAGGSVEDPGRLLAAALGAEGAALLRPYCEAVVLDAGATLLQEGVPAAHLFLIVAGAVAVQVDGRGGPVEVARCGPGAWLGEVGFIDRGPATSTVVAVDRVSALRIRHENLLQMETEAPRAAAALLRHVTRQLAQRIANGSAGVVEEVAPGTYRFRQPAEARDWMSRVFGWIVGGDAP